MASRRQLLVGGLVFLALVLLGIQLWFGLGLWRARGSLPLGGRSRRQGSACAHGGSSAFDPSRQCVVLRPPLEAALSRYAARHASKSPPKGARYLVYYPEDGNAGIGNALIGLVSTFLVALLTDRTLVIQWGDGAMALKSPTRMNWQWAENPKLVMVARGAMPDVRVLNGKTDLEHWLQLLMCDDFNERYPDTFVHMTSNQYFGPFLALNPHYAQTMKEWFGETHSQLYSALAQFLLVPSQRLEGALQSARADFSAYNVGVQVRRLDNAPVARRSLQVFEQCAQQLGAQYEDVVGDPSQVRWFVASDDAKTREVFNSKFPGRVITPTPSERRLAAFVDVWLLSECDDIIISSGSTYGYIAHAMHSVVPHVVLKSGHCMRMLTSEPCVHVWDALINAEPDSEDTALPKCYDKAALEKKLYRLVNNHQCWP